MSTTKLIHCVNYKSNKMRTIKMRSFNKNDFISLLNFISIYIICILIFNDLKRLYFDQCSSYILQKKNIVETNIEADSSRMKF